MELIDLNKQTHHPELRGMILNFFTVAGEGTIICHERLQNKYTIQAGPTALVLSHEKEDEYKLLINMDTASGEFYQYRHGILQVKESTSEYHKDTKWLAVFVDNKILMDFKVNTETTTVTELTVFANNIHILRGRRSTIKDAWGKYICEHELLAPGCDDTDQVNYMENMDDEPFGCCNYHASHLPLSSYENISFRVGVVVNDMFNAIHIIPEGLQSAGMLTHVMDDYMKEFRDNKK